MQYEEFRKVFDGALRASGVSMVGASAEETLDTRCLTRRYKTHLESSRREVGPFYVGAGIWFEWDALMTERGRTPDEQVLSQIIERDPDEYDEVETLRPTIRVDIELRATTLWGKHPPLPNRSAWQAWAKSLQESFEGKVALIPPRTIRETLDGRAEVLAWQGEPRADVGVGPLAGELLLRGVYYSAFQLLELPRIIEDSEVEPDPAPNDELQAMFGRVRSGLAVWGEALKELTKP